MDSKTIIDFWRIIFECAKARQEEGSPCGYMDLLADSFACVPKLVKKIPDLIDVDITEDLVEEWLRQVLATKGERMADKRRRLSLRGEEWRVVPGYSRYWVSSLGRTWSDWEGKIMRPQKNSKRYLNVSIRRDDGVFKRQYIHRLVAQVFVPNPEGFETVDHINEDKMDNRASNLRWMSAKENMEAYMRNHGYWYNPDAWHPGKPRKRSRAEEGGDPIPHENLFATIHE